MSIPASWQPYVDLAAEALFASALVAGFAGMAWIGKRHRLHGQPGWRPMLAGMGLLAMWALVDLADEFWTSMWVVAGMDLEPIVEDLILPLAGVSLLAAGILRWAPLHARLAAAETERRDDELTHLRQMDHFKTTFLNTAAHELATPLTPIRLQLSILKGREEGGRDVDVLDRNVTRMERLVQDLLDASRLQSGRLQFDLDRTDVSALVEELGDWLRDQCEAKGIRFEADVGPGLRMEAADEVRLSQVLFNLGNNAVKFTEAGGTIRLRLWRKKGSIIIEMEDTGAGMEAAELQDLFAPFKQFHREQVGPHVGTGLGLYIAHGIVRRHGGSIEAHSEGRGHGSRFRIRLPARAKDVPDGSQEPVRREVHVV